MKNGFLSQKLMFILADFRKNNTCGDILVSVPRQAVVNQLDNPAWPKASHRARTELNVY
jgi:hypothetical protein